MGILIMGMGYVGVTTGLVLAELGWNVIGYDPNMDRLSALTQGGLPFYEPELSDRLQEHGKSGRMRFTTELEGAIAASDTIFLCVGTPAREDGSADLRYIEQAARSIGKYMSSDKLIVIKSTVPVGTNEQVYRWVGEEHKGSARYDVVSNPEFLREGSAWYDALHPDRIVIGSKRRQAARKVERLFKDIPSPAIICNPRTAELIKYASNAFLATKISYVNELARLCDKLGVNVIDVAAGMGLDDRIGKRFLHAGIGYGGSCFPKDTQALLYESEKQGVLLTILDRVVHVNHTQAHYALDLWESALGIYADKTIAVLGLSFKKDTDDMREAPSLTILEELLDRQAVVQAHDPLARLPKERRTDRLQQFDTIEGALYDADAVILASDWKQYVEADWKRLKRLMKQPIIFDGKNMLNRKQIKSLGYRYFGVGTNDDLAAATSEARQEERMNR